MKGSALGRCSWHFGLASWVEGEGGSGLSLLHNGEMTAIEALYHSSITQFTVNFHPCLYGFMFGSHCKFYTRKTGEGGYVI